MGYQVTRNVQDWTLHEWKTSVQEVTGDNFDTVEYRRCQRFEPDYPSYYFGARGGMTMVLNAQTDDYIPLVENNHLGQGLMLQVAYGGEEMGQWTTLTPGMRTSVAMQIKNNTVRFEEKSMLNPFAYFDSDPQCFENPKLMFSNITRYTQVNAWMDCSYMVSQAMCNCIPIQVEGYRACEIEEMLKCYSFAACNLSEEECMAIIDKFKQCLANIREPCSATLVDVQLSTTHFPSDRQNDSWNNWVKSKMKSVPAKDLILLDLYFRTYDVKV
uniref:VWFD domain-containing protein n=1 Tax=Plectus sambesii TaxID=2011161 RepID=A0A914WL34_9BILA